jgi:hypothetical protein
MLKDGQRGVAGGGGAAEIGQREGGDGSNMWGPMCQW